MSPPHRPRVLERVAAEYLLKIGAVPRLEWRLQGPALRAIHRLQRATWPARYTDADPLPLLWVDPAAITHHVNRDEVPRIFGRVAGGHWDRHRENGSRRPTSTARSRNGS
ncbi:hypothetical protein [Saliphagus infecundisoli]|uniref:Uncharacterized protein n=1 Tax=Saliphagus infecundisoli TaxID=1849069 RepID=A0ABD5QIS6_9EURY|nr:hypothetical protein [Saliphagus infecundisoli]